MFTIMYSSYIFLLRFFPKRRTASHGDEKKKENKCRNEEYGNITTPYTYGETVTSSYTAYSSLSAKLKCELYFLFLLPAGTDSRPASELLVEQRHMQLLEHIRKLEEKIDGMTPPWLSKRST